MDGNIFISWSGQRSRELAAAMKKFVPYVIQQAKPWMSTVNIDKGSRWSDEINQALEAAQIGIVCLTSDNLNAPWILFESGAIAKKFQTARVCAYLLDMSPTDVSLPLSQFNLTKAEKADTLELMRTLNRALGNTLDPARLEDTFNQFWPGLEKEIVRIRQISVEDRKPKREVEEILTEMVNRLQAIEQQRGDLKTYYLDWHAVRTYLQVFSAKLADEIVSLHGLMERIQELIVEEESEPNLLSRKQARHFRELELQHAQKLQTAIIELIRASETTSIESPELSVSISLRRL